jgi:hypothetical protein
MSTDNKIPEVKIETMCALFSHRSLMKFLALEGQDESVIRQMRRARRLPPPDVIIGNRPRWKPETIQSLVASGRIGLFCSHATVCRLA